MQILQVTCMQPLLLLTQLLRPNEQLMAFKESTDIDSIIPDLTSDKNVTAVVYQIRFITEPGGGDWEVSLTYFTQSKEFVLSQNDISRLNSYYSQALCVLNTHPHLRTFCHCVQ